MSYELVSGRERLRPLFFLLMMKERTETLFDPDLYKSLKILEIKCSCYFKFPKGKRKYYVSIKKDIDTYKDENKYRFPIYDLSSRMYTNMLEWTPGYTRFHNYGYSRLPKNVILYLSWDTISL